MHRAAVFLVLVSLAGCAAATPGYTPPDSSAKLPPAMQPFHGGRVDEHGRYIVSDAERALSCPKLTGSMQITIERIKESGDRPRTGAIANGMQAAAEPFVGKGANLDVDEEVRFGRARVVAYNQLLAEKKCKTLDLTGL